MNNTGAQRLLEGCSDELSSVKNLIDNLGVASNAAPFLTKYAIIRACATIEQAFKSILCDFCAHGSKKQVTRFLDQRVRDSSANPSYSNILKLVKDFDEDWQTQFKESVNSSPNKDALMGSLSSLVAARNNFAHGGNPSASISDVITYFSHSRTIIELLDSTVK
jgi:hypothetical protein